MTERPIRLYTPGIMRMAFRVHMFVQECDMSLGFWIHCRFRAPRPATAPEDGILSLAAIVTAARETCRNCGRARRRGGASGHYSRALRIQLLTRSWRNGWRATIKPDDAASQSAALHGRCGYCWNARARPILPFGARVCTRSKLPRPERRLADRHGAPKGHVELIRPAACFKRARPCARPHLVQLVAAAPAPILNSNVDLVPVAIFLGPRPHKEAQPVAPVVRQDWVLGRLSASFSTCSSTAATPWALRASRCRLRDGRAWTA